MRESVDNNFFNFKYELGERIRDRRLELGFNQDLFSIRTGLSRQTLSSIENGNRFPTVQTLLIIACELKEPLSYFQPDVLDPYMTVPHELLRFNEYLQQLPFSDRHMILRLINDGIENVISA